MHDDIAAAGRNRAPSTTRTCRRHRRPSRTRRDARSTRARSYGRRPAATARAALRELLVCAGLA